ncbi:MAG: xanthine dehydrogenase family protein molybdopterin-binding subunit [Hyphomicrobiaceae bacterium]
MHMHRLEDERLLTGRGVFTDDIEAPDALVGVFVRSPHAHAELGAIDRAAAIAIKGASLVLTGDDLAKAGVKPIAITPRLVDPDGKPPRDAPWPILAQGRVRHVGEPVALCIGATTAIAQAMADALQIAYQPLPAVTALADAKAPGAPQLTVTVPGNLVFHWELGDKAAMASAMAAAAHVVAVERTSQRVIICPMEPRAAVASFDAKSGRFLLQTGNQAMTLLRDQAAACLGVDKHAITVTSRDVGGAFGIRNGVYPEYPALMVAVRQLGRPVRWTATRSEAFQSDAQARDSHMRGRLALDGNGRFLALHVTADAAMGAYMQQVGYFIACANFARCIAGPYRVPALHVGVDCVLTNTVPTAPYRGAGRPEAALIMESLVEAAALKLGIDAIELRRRNMLGAGDMPHKTAAGTVYDSGDFPGAMEQVLKAADWSGIATRKARSLANGRLRGIGLGCFVEISGGVPNERAQMRLERDGRVHVRTAVGATGQGHETVFAMMSAEHLQLPVDRVVVGQGDSTGFEDGGSSSASRSTTMAGLAMRAAALKLIEVARGRAAVKLQVGPEQLDYKDGRFAAPGTNLAISLAELVQEGDTIFVDEKIEALPTFPNGCHIAEVEIDPETGVMQLVAYTAVDDCGRVIAHEFAEGQIYGALAQGIGQAMMEHGQYDRESGQLIAGSMMDYILPRAEDLPRFNSALRPQVARSNPLGVKGVGESGTVGALPSIMNAALDALRPLGVTDLQLPLTPERLWRAIQDAKGT